MRLNSTAGRVALSLAAIVISVGMIYIGVKMGEAMLVPFNDVTDLADGARPGDFDTP